MRIRSVSATPAVPLPLPNTRPLARVGPAVPVRAARARGSALARWGWLPVISVLGALGLLSVSAANWLSASGVSQVEPLFWLGLLVVIGPTAARLLSTRAARCERLALVLLLGLNLYAVKLMQSPFGFTYSDEFIHLYNLNQIVATGRLFTTNPILPASSLYPGLESAAAGLVQIAGLDAFSAGLLVVGLARGVLMLALFLFYEQLTGSARAAGLAGLLYAANDNFLFWSAQFSYESLALPLAMLALYLIARRESGRAPAERVGLTLAALVMISAVVVTHHLTSYFLAGFLLLWLMLAWLVRLAQRAAASQLWAAVRSRLPRPAQPPHRAALPLPGAATGGPGALALFAGLAALAWLTLVASFTLTYLTPVFRGAAQSMLQMVVGQETGRALFAPGASGFVTPLWERAVGLAAVGLCLLGLPFGLWQVWRRYRRHPVVLLLAGAALAYFASLGLRFIPSAWEIGNRASEFLFIGLALVLGLARLPRWLRLWGLWRPLAAAGILVIFAGGLIAGWPAQLRVAQVARVPVAGRILQPQAMTAAQWSLAYLGANHKFAADEAAGRDLMAYANQRTLVGRQQSVRSIFEDPTLRDWQIQLLWDSRIEFLAVDRRLLGSDNMAGYFFDRGQAWPLPPDQLEPEAAYLKFDQLPQVSRIFDTGDLVLYDVRDWLNGPTAPQP